jgi:phosphoglycerate dehydrogenase-like enzyme
LHCSALENGSIKAAALDVTAAEPVADDWRGYSLPSDKMLLSCHSCDSTADMSLRSADYFIANLQRWIAGEALQHIVDKTRGY